MFILRIKDFKYYRESKKQCFEAKSYILNCRKNWLQIASLIVVTFQLQSVDSMESSLPVWRPLVILIVYYGKVKLWSGSSILLTWTSIITGARRCMWSPTWWSTRPATSGGGGRGRWWGCCGSCGSTPTCWETQPGLTASHTASLTPPPSPPATPSRSGSSRANTPSCAVSGNRIKSSKNSQKLDFDMIL